MITKLYGLASCCLSRLKLSNILVNRARLGFSSEIKTKLSHGCKSFG